MASGKPKAEMAPADVTRTIEVAAEPPPAVKTKPDRPPRPKAAVKPPAVAPDGPVVVVGDAREPRYEPMSAHREHVIIADPETHVRHCKHCHAPEHMADVACEPREFT
jgi:hypothetical protein